MLTMTRETRTEHEIEIPARVPAEPKVGDTLMAVKGGSVHAVTVTRVTRYTITTDDWRTWWNHQEGRERGESVSHPLNRLLFEE